MERKVYQFKVEPKAAQRQAFNRFAGARRFVFNWALARRVNTFKATGKSISWNELSVELTALKQQAEFAWLKEMGSQALQQALADCKKSFDNFFAKRSRFPRFKSKKDSTQSFRFPQNVKIENGKVSLPKIGEVKIRQSQQIEGKSKSATFKRDATGNWFVTIVAEFELPKVEPPKVSKDEVLGVDFGLKSFITTSEGEEKEAPKIFRKAQKRLRLAHRQLLRRKKGSANRSKAKQKIAIIHRAITNKRADFIHQLTHTLIKENTAISVESLNLKGMAKTKLSKSVLDAAPGEFFRQIKYKARWRHRHAVFVDPWFPSSKLCSICGYKNVNLQLSDREWLCPDCHTLHHRDINAAVNLKDEGFKMLVVAGHAKTLNACGANVRPVFQAVSVEAGISIHNL